MKIETYEEGGRREIIWKMDTGTAGEWELGQVNISGMNIIFTVEKAAGNNGFVALDELLLVDNIDKCDTQPKDAVVDKTTTSTTTPKPTTTTTKSPYPDCDFENDWCHWVNGDNIDNQTDIFVFIRTLGELHSDGDGPEHDHADDKTSMFQSRSSTLNQLTFRIFSLDKCSLW